VSATALPPVIRREPNGPTVARGLATDGDGVTDDEGVTEGDGVSAGGDGFAPFADRPRPLLPPTAPAGGGADAAATTTGTVAGRSRVIAQRTPTITVSTASAAATVMRLLIGVLRGAGAGWTAPR
jgi:hypothetical protein